MAPSDSSDPALVRAGRLCRADAMFSHVLYERVGRLYEDRLEVVHVKHEHDDRAVPELTVPLPGLAVDPIRERKLTVKPSSMNLLQGYVTGGMREAIMFSFKLAPPEPVRRSRRGRSILPDTFSKLTLAFRSRDQAERWRALILQHATRTNSTPQPPEHIPPICNAVPERSSDSLGAVNGSTIPAVSARQRLLPAHAPTDPSSLWSAFFRWNGLACYQEAGPQGAYAASCVISATPLQVFQHLVRLQDGSSAWNVFEGVNVLEHRPDNERDLVFHAQLKKADGFLGFLQSLGLIAPRDVLLQQNWSLSDFDGTIALHYSSVEHRGDPRKRRQRSWNNFWLFPVRAQIEHLGFTISPLAEMVWGNGSRRPEDSPECLVTMIMHVDFGGLLSYSASLFVLVQALVLRWVAVILGSLVQMRDSLEQLRFALPSLKILGRWDSEAGGFAGVSELVEQASWGKQVSKEISMVRGRCLSRGLGKSRRQESAQGATVASALDGGVDAAASSTPFDSDQPEKWLEECYYSSPPGHGFQVRGKHYLTDRVKTASAEPAFALRGVELLATDAPGVTHISPYLPLVMHSSDAIMFVVHLTLPFSGKNLHLVCVFGTDDVPVESDGRDTPFTRALGLFYTGTGKDADRTRDDMLKLIPMVRSGSWVIRQAVGATPVILGRKLISAYHKGPHYLEATMDIQSDVVAGNITKIVGGSMRYIKIAMGFVLEGKVEEHLPEQLLGTVSLDNLDLGYATHLDVSTPLRYRFANGNGAQAISQHLGSRLPSPAPFSELLEDVVAGKGLPPPGNTLKRRKGSVDAPPRVTDTAELTSSASAPNSRGKYEAPLPKRVALSPLSLSFPGAEAFQESYESGTLKKSLSPFHC